jgi:hypothetical protein
MYMLKNSAPVKFHSYKSIGWYEVRSNLYYTQVRYYLHVQVNAYLSWPVCSNTLRGLFLSTRWFKYDRDKLWLVYTQIFPVIFEPPCIYKQ